MIVRKLLTLLIKSVLIVAVHNIWSKKNDRRHEKKYEMNLKIHLEIRIRVFFNIVRIRV